MDRPSHDRTGAARIARLEAELADTRSQLAALIAEVRGRAPSGEPVEIQSEGSGVTRRGLMTAAGATAVGTVVGLLATGSPAAANGQGQALTIGDPSNTATNTTGLAATLNDKAVLRVQNQGTKSGVWGILGSSNNGSLAAGVLGDSVDGVGVQGLSQSSAGVQGAGAVGVYGVGTDVGVRGFGSFGGPGVEGTGLPIGVRGVVGTSGIVNQNGGVVGDSDSQHGVVGTTSFGFRAGVLGMGTTWGVSAQASGGVGVRAQGSAAPLQLVPSATAGAPAAGAHAVGELYTDSGGAYWACVAAGTPGTWRKLAAPSAAGAFHVLPAPVRVYDSRAGTTPATGPKTPLAANTPRTLDVSLNGSGVPTGATAVSVTLLLVNTAAGNGNFTIWANGVAKPAANNMVWGGSLARYSSPATTAVDAARRCQVVSNLATDLVLDVVGYYR